MMKWNRIRLLIAFAIIAIPVFAPRSGMAQRRPPDWSVGTFKGVNKKYATNLEVVINSSGSIRVRSTDNDNRSSTKNGSYRNGKAYIDGNYYTIEQVFRGIRLTQDEDKSNVVNLSKIGGEGGYDPEDERPGGGGGSSNVPGWAIGSFSGHNNKYDNDVDLTVNRSGSVRARLTEPNGRVTNQSGTLRNSRVTLGSRTFTVTSISNGIRLVEVGDRSHRIDLTRDSSGGSGGSGSYDRPPSWMTGTFEARNEQYDSDVEMTVSSNGRITSRVTDRNGKVSTSRGAYRDGNIELDGKEYSVRRSGDGLTLTEIGNSSNRYHYRRAN